MPKQEGRDCTTTIIQQSGSILLEVEKQNVQHFQVETPYLAAVVKGTQFRVTVGSRANRASTCCAARSRSPDFKTGQFAMVAPGQAAQVSDDGQRGLALSGTGIFAAIQQGTPRASTVARAAGRPRSCRRRPSPPDARGLGARRHAVDARHDAGAHAGRQQLAVGVHAEQGVRRHTAAADTTTEDITLSIAFSILIGAAVTIGVGRPAPAQGQEDDTELTLAS